MTKEQITNIIIEEILAIAPEINPADIILDQHIQKSLEIDSFDFLKIITALNDRLGVEVPENDYSKVDTIEHMSEYFFLRRS